MLPKDYKPSKPVAIFFIGVLLVVIIYGSYMALNRSKAFSSGSRYTIGYTVEKSFNMSGGLGVTYRYSVDGVEYKGNSRHSYNSKVPEGRYWVMYSVAKPDISTLYQDKPVPSSIESVPPDGYKKIPYR